MVKMSQMEVQKFGMNHLRLHFEFNVVSLLYRGSQGEVCIPEFPSRIIELDKLTLGNLSLLKF